MKILKTALVLTLVGLLCGAVIGAANFITEPIIKRNAELRAQKAYKSFFEDLDDMEEHEIESGSVYVYIKIKKGDQLLGYVFKAKGTNQRGLLDLGVAYDTEGKIVGIKILETENTAGFYDQYIDDKNNTLVGIRTDDALTVDKIGGVTQTGELLNKLLADINTASKEYVKPAVEVDPYLELFENKETVEEDTAFTKTDAVTKKEIVKDAEGTVLGHVYTVVDSTSKDPKSNLKEIPYTGEGKLEYLIGLDLENNIVGMYKVVNNHSGSYFNKYETALAALIGQPASDASLDNIADSTISGNALNRILEALKAVLSWKKKINF